MLVLLKIGYKVLCGDIGKYGNFQILKMPFNCINYSASNGQMFLTDELEIMWRDSLMSYCTVSAVLVRFTEHTTLLVTPFYLRLH
jgi:hypothetical protein